MIRSFKDKMKKKQEAYEAKQKVLAEQAEQARIKKEWELFDLEQEKVKQQSQQIIIEEESRQHAEYLQWKQEQRLLQEQADQAPIEKINTGVGIGHASTWKLTWQSFSTHPDIVNLPMSEKIRLYKLAEQQQIDRLNYYANLNTRQWTGQYVIGSKHYWQDGVIDELDITSDSSGDLRDGIINEDVVWDNSVDVNIPLTVEAGATLTVNGILTVNGAITNNGTIIVNGIIVKQFNIINNGTLTIN